LVGKEDILHRWRKDGRLPLEFWKAECTTIDFFATFACFCELEDLMLACFSRFLEAIKFRQPKVLGRKKLGRGRPKKKSKIPTSNFADKNEQEQKKSQKRTQKTKTKK
jgi:hypothetical protein